MKTTAQKWGNSLAIRVPKSIAQQAGLKVKDDLDIEVRKGALVLRPHLRRVYRLEDLLKRTRHVICIANSTSAGQSVERRCNEPAIVCARSWRHRLAAKGLQATDSPVTGERGAMAFPHT